MPQLIPDYYYIMLLMIAPTSLVAQTVKHLSTMRETRVRSLGREDPLEKEMMYLFLLPWGAPEIVKVGSIVILEKTHIHPSLQPAVRHC